MVIVSAINVIFTLIEVHNYGSDSSL